MTQDSLGIAVIGVGMVGRAHAAGYRTAASLYDISGRYERARLNRFWLVKSECKDKYEGDIR